MKKLAIVLPCYNEEDVLQSSIDIIKKYLEGLIEKRVVSSDSFLCFVDDGSKDSTWSIIRDNSRDKSIKGIKLSNNFGHQNALLAGLFFNENSADMYVTIDCDLQDDIEVIKDMMDSFNRGSEIVYGVRKSRKTDTLFKRKSAEMFYDIQGKLGIDIIKNHADFRLISNKVLNHLKRYEEVNLYLRAMFPVIGFSSDKVFYDRKERTAGETKYPLKKMFSFAWDGITSFSTFPLKMITGIGTVIFLLSMLMVFYIFAVKLFTNQAIPGWASTMIPIYFIGGIQLLSLGIIGEYIGKIYKESKKRPRYIIEESINGR